MPGSATVYARIFDYSANDTFDDGTLHFTIEWKLLIGNRAGGKFQWTSPEAIASDDRLSDDIRDALADHLSTMFAPTEFRARDILGL
jgi:hypothetical protein